MPTATPHTHGVPIGKLRRIRVRKAHVRAALEAVARTLEELPAGQTEISEEAAEAVAASVITAEDHRRTEYVIGVRTDDGQTLILGPYRTYWAALKAIDNGLPLPGRAGIFPLIPHPRREPEPRPGDETGPCALCGTPMLRYGPASTGPLCGRCRPIVGPERPGRAS